MIILDKFPSAEEFYQTYWGKRPFVVRNAIEDSVFEGLVDGDTLAGISLEEDVKSRIVITESKGKKWSCDHGPFDEGRFATLGEKNWSLLVQNVEQYHVDTANLLRFFNFSPRWLMDDIMVSYSAVGGSVGPHTDSYHVFLVQGKGHRKWTVGNAPVVDGSCVEGLDLKVLKEDIDGTEVDVLIGDVIYIPPNFAHEGVTIEDSLTFSVGFLGPKISELLVEYGLYLEQIEQQDNRYNGQGLCSSSAGFLMAPQTQKMLQNELLDTIQSNVFLKWLAIYFSTPTHDEVDNIEMRDNQLSDEEMLKHLQAGSSIYKPEHIKLSVTVSLEGARNLAVYGKVFSLSEGDDAFINLLNKGKAILNKNMDMLEDRDELVNIITCLYNQNVLFFENDDLN